MRPTIVAISLAAALLAACGGGSEMKSTPAGSATVGSSPTPADGIATVFATATPTPVPTSIAGAGPYPIGTRTGIASVDAAIAAVESGDRSRLQAAWHFMLSPCATLPPPGGLRCPAGVAAGTGLPVIFVEGTDGAALTREEAVSLNVGAALLDGSTLDRRVYAVVDVRGRSPTEWYRIVFATGQAVVVDDVGITYFPCRCQRTPAQQLSTEANPGALTFVLPPR